MAQGEFSSVEVSSVSAVRCGATEIPISAVSSRYSNRVEYRVYTRANADSGWMLARTQPATARVAAQSEAKALAASGWEALVNEEVRDFTGRLVDVTRLPPPPRVPAFARETSRPARVA